MVEAGLVVSGDDIPVPFDRFRDRVMFPITDLRGRVIAFGGRAMEKDAPAKYLNSPETPLFHKGSTLYNIAAARQAAHDGAQVIAVEGYVDVIAMVTAGFPATVAPLGTALTEDQLALLWRMADEPVLCFDGDKAGVRAAYRAVDVALPRLKPGKSLKFALLPDGQDPDDLVRAAGREAVADVINAARPLAGMLWARETEGHQFDTPERRAALEARLNEVTSGIADETVRRYYREDFRDRLAPFLKPPANAARAPPQPRRGGGRGGGGRRALAAAAERRAGGAWRTRPLPAPPARGRAQHALRRGQPAAREQPRASRFPHGRAAAGGADPAGRAQPSVALARPPRGAQPSRIPPFRRRTAKSDPDRHRCACGDPRPGRAKGGTFRPQSLRRCRAGHRRDHDRLGLGGARGCSAQRRAGHLEPAHRLASTVAFTT